MVRIRLYTFISLSEGTFPSPRLSCSLFILFLSIIYPKFFAPSFSSLAFVCFLWFLSASYILFLYSHFFSLQVSSTFLISLSLFLLVLLWLLLHFTTVLFSIYISTLDYILFLFQLPFVLLLPFSCSPHTSLLCPFLLLPVPCWLHFPFLPSGLMSYILLSASRLCPPAWVLPSLFFP